MSHDTSAGEDWSLYVNNLDEASAVRGERALREAGLGEETRVVDPGEKFPLILDLGTAQALLILLQGKAGLVYNTENEFVERDVSWAREYLADLAIDIGAFEAVAKTKFLEWYSSLK